MSTGEFATTNLAVAAYLTAGRHLRLLDVDVSDPQHAQFVFEDPTAQGSQLETNFLTEGALVPGADFHRQLRVLRRMIEERGRVTHQRELSRNVNQQGFEERVYSTHS